ncbi:MAG: universal stress protein [Thermaceae bacterium]
MNLLLATDGSLAAQSAEVLAEWLAYKLQARLRVLFVRDERLIRFPQLLDLGALSIPLPVRHEEIEEALTLRGEAILSRIKRSAEEAGIPVETFLETGLPHEVIVRYARSADLLVMGRAGEAHIGEFLGLGSTADRVLRTSPTPALLAPLDYLEPTAALLGYNATESAVRALRVLRPLAKALGLPVRVVSVHEDPKVAGEWALEAQAYLEEEGVRAEALALRGDPGEHLLRLAEPEDLLALGAPVRRFVLGSTAEYVIRHALGPVLTVR